MLNFHDIAVIVTTLPNTRCLGVLMIINHFTNQIKTIKEHTSSDPLLYLWSTSTSTLAKALANISMSPAWLSLSLASLAKLTRLL